MSGSRMTLVLCSMLVATVWVANWLVEHVGTIPVGFGLQAPAAVLVAGLAFTLRDLLHAQAGRGWVLAAIAAGGALSLLISPAFALASAAAFTVSELADLTVYEPVSRSSWIAAVTLSNTVGLVLDSLLFLWLAFGSLAFLPGQIVGKAWMTLAAIVVLFPIRYRVALLARHA